MRPESRALPRVLRFAGLFAGLVLLVPLVATAGGGAPGKSSSAYGWSDGERSNRFAWGLMDPADGHSTMDTDGDDWREIQRLMRDEDEPVFWFRLDGRNYVVRDPALVARANELAEPVRALGNKQGRLGARQGALGSQQARLGARQAELGGKQARLSARLSRLSYAASADERRANRELQREIEDAMAELSRQQGELGEEQGRLGALQGELGREQGEMGREQARLGKVVGAEMRKLAEEALKAGAARPVGRSRSI